MDTQQKDHEEKYQFTGLTGKVSAIELEYVECLKN